jgi:hypothetical protein
MMHSRANGGYKSLYPAPPRETLKKFGGNLTIEEFRTYGGKTAPPIVRYPNEVFLQQVLSEKDGLVSQYNATKSGAANSSKMKAIEDTTVQGDTLKLKRAKPLERSKSKLETSLGIKRKEK